MAYIKNNWVDREGTTRYFETVDDDGALILTPDYTQVTEMGTPVNADNMNHIEEGIAAGSFTKYDTKTTYYENDLVTNITGNELKVYKSLKDENTNNNILDTLYWEEVELGGVSLEILDQFVAKESMREVPCITETYRNGKSGYIVYSNGYCEQWGRITATGSYTTVTLLKAYKDTDFWCMANCQNRDTGDAKTHFLWTQPLSTSSIEVGAWQAGYLNSWITKGYIA